MPIELHCRVSDNVRLSITPVGDTQIEIADASNPAIVLDPTQNNKLIGCLAPHTISCVGATSNTGCISFDGPVTVYFDDLGVEIRANDEADLIAKINAMPQVKLKAELCAPEYDFIIPLSDGTNAPHMVGANNVGLMMDVLYPTQNIEGMVVPAAVSTTFYIKGALVANPDKGQAYGSPEDGDEFIRSLFVNLTYGLYSLLGYSPEGFPALTDSPINIDIVELANGDVLEYLPLTHRPKNLNPFTLHEPIDGVAEQFKWYGVKIDLTKMPKPTGPNRPTALVLRRPEQASELSSVNFRGETQHEIGEGLPTSINSFVMAPAITIPIGGEGRDTTKNYSAETNLWAIHPNGYLGAVYRDYMPMTALSGLMDADYKFGNPIDATLTAINIDDITEATTINISGAPLVYCFNFRGAWARLLKVKMTAANRVMAVINTVPDREYVSYVPYPDGPSENTGATNNFPYSKLNDGDTFSSVHIDASLRHLVDYNGVNAPGNVVSIRQNISLMSNGTEYEVIVLVPALSTVIITKSQA